MKFGIIGTGNMGTILIEALLDSNAVKASDLVIINRTYEKASRIKKRYPAIHIAGEINEVGKRCQFIFICVKPFQIFPLLQEMKDVLNEDKVIVSITSSISVEELENATNCQVARMIPSITNRALSGCTLLTFGNRISEENKQTLYKLASTFSEPYEISEEFTRAASDIASCGPAFFSYLLQRFIDGAVEQTAIPKDLATELTNNMLIGFAKLIENNYYSLETLQEKVTVKGGITGIGIELLKERIGNTFDELFKETQRKFAEDRKRIIEQFYNNVK